MGGFTVAGLDLSNMMVGQAVSIGERNFKWSGKGFKKETVAGTVDTSTIDTEIQEITTKIAILDNLSVVDGNLLVNGQEIQTGSSSETTQEVLNILPSL